VANTKALVSQILGFTNERVKKGASCDSKSTLWVHFLFCSHNSPFSPGFLDFCDLEGNISSTDKSAFLWGLHIWSTPMHYYSHLMLLTILGNTTDRYKSHFSAIPKIPYTIVEEVDFLKAGIVLSPFLTLNQAHP
jgi:hypothetical protein